MVKRLSDKRVLPTSGDLVVFPDSRSFAIGATIGKVICRAPGATHPHGCYRVAGGPGGSTVVTFEGERGVFVPCA